MQNQALVFQYNKMAFTIINAINDKPDDESEWRNVMQLMYHFRKVIGCSICNELAEEQYSPLQKPCHTICRDCVNNKSQSNNCDVCREGLRKENGFEMNKNLEFATSCYGLLCQLIEVHGLTNKWSNLEVSTQNGPVKFTQLAQEGCDFGDSEENFSLGDKFSKRVKEKEHHCRCGSGAKKERGQNSGNLTCLGQRCACYKEKKGCTNCKCSGCKNPFGTSSNT